MANEYTKGFNSGRIVGINTGIQFVNIYFDAIVIALNRKFKFGKKRINRIYDSVIEILAEYEENAKSGTDYALHKLQLEAERIYGGELPTLDIPQTSAVFKKVRR